MIAYTTLQNDSRSGFRNISTKLPSYLVQKYFGIIQWHFFHTRLMIEVFMIGPLMCTEKWQKTQQKSSWQIKLEIVNQHNVLKFINNTVFNYSWSCFTTAFFFPAELHISLGWKCKKKRKEKKKSKGKKTLRVRERKITTHTKTGHYFSTAGETVKHYFVLFNLSLCNITCNHLGVNQLIPYFKQFYAFHKYDCLTTHGAVYSLHSLVFYGNSTIVIK